MKKGFTLIELLAVIVILAIIALIATPIVLNIIKESRENANIRSAEMYLDAVEISIARKATDGGVPNGTYDILDTGNICLEYEDTKCTEEFTVEVDGTVPSIGSTITISNGKITATSLLINNKTVVKNDKGQLVYQLSPCTYDDVDKSGTINLSDVVTCGTESFYVMENDGTNITMLSKYNLNVGDNSYPNGTIGIQNKNAVGEKDGYTTYGTVAFSNENYWADLDTLNPLPAYGLSYLVYAYDANSNLFSYVSEYEKYLREKLKIRSATTTLMRYSHFYKLNQNQEAIIWLYATTFWMGEAGACNDPYYVASVGSTHNLCGDNIGNSWYSSSSNNGIRPVVTISTSEVQ